MKLYHNDLTFLKQETYNGMQIRSITSRLLMCGQFPTQGITSYNTMYDERVIVFHD